MRINWLFSVEHTDSMFLLNVFVFSHKPTIVTVYMTRLVVLHFTSHGTSCIVTLHVLWHSRVMAFHVLWYFMPHVNQDLHRKILNFTREYLCVTTHELSHMCEVIVELYHSILNTLMLHWTRYS